MPKKVIRKRASFGSTLKKDLYIDLQRLSETTDIPMTKLLDRAVDLLLEDMSNDFVRESKPIYKTK
jgi:hypothetical protein